MNDARLSAGVNLPIEPPSFTGMVSLDLNGSVPIIAFGAILAAAWYLTAVKRTRSIGRRWPRYRTASFLAGCAITAAVTGLQIDSYGYAMFSVFVFQHLTLSMAVPPLLVLGSPGRLLLRATPHHGPGHYVVRGALSALRSPIAAALVHPAVTVPLFLFSYYGLYLTPLFDLVADSRGGHIAMELFFLGSGILFILPVLATGPVPGRHTNLGRFFELFVEMPLHVFFGLFLMMATSPLTTTFASPPDSWNVDALDDQQLAGGLAWSYGEPVAVFVIIVFATRWRRDEKLSNAVIDQRADRDGNTELDDYNNYLRNLSNGPAGHR